MKSKIKARLLTLGLIRKDARLFSASGHAELLALMAEPAIKQMLVQSFAVLNQMLESLSQATQAMVKAVEQFPQVRLLQTALGVGIITACRFVAYIQTPRRFSNKRKLCRYARLGITRREQSGKRLAHPRLDAASLGSLKDVSRKVFEAAQRTKGSNSFKQCFEQSLLNTKNQVHAPHNKSGKSWLACARCGSRCSRTAKTAADCHRLLFNRCATALVKKN